MRGRGHLPGGPLLPPERLPRLGPAPAERKLDIPKLANSVIGELNQTYERKKSLTAGAEAVLLQYAWPGNVRELRNVMERAFIISDGDEIQAEDLAILDNGNLHIPKTISPTYGMGDGGQPHPAPSPIPPDPDPHRGEPPGPGGPL